jgi:hypothetical protein
VCLCVVCMCGDVCVECVCICVCGVCVYVFVWSMCVYVFVCGGVYLCVCVECVVGVCGVCLCVWHMCMCVFVLVCMWSMGVGFLGIVARSGIPEGRRGNRKIWSSKLPLLYNKVKDSQSYKSPCLT